MKDLMLGLLALLLLFAYGIIRQQAAEFERYRLWAESYDVPESGPPWKMS